MAVARGPRPQYLGLMLLFVVLRSAFLGTLENPEPRYTLECYPVVLAAGRRLAGHAEQEISDCLVQCDGTSGGGCVAQAAVSSKLSIRRVAPM